MKFLKPNWNAPQFVKCFTTQIDNSCPSQDINVCLKNSLDMETSIRNRKKIQQTLGFKNQPAWLNQTHSSNCLNISHTTDRNADASVTQTIQQPLVIVTADCLPIMICHQTEPEIAAIHAGWKGLFSGIIEQTFSHLSYPSNEYLVWFGPAICVNCYPVSPEYRLEFLKKFPNSEKCFIQKQQWHFSLTQMAEQILTTQGITQIYHSKECTFENQAFYSYRRSHGGPGRIATFIWLEDVNEIS